MREHIARMRSLGYRYEVKARDLRRFDRFLKEQLNMSAEERRVAARIWNEAKDSAVPAEDFARQIRQLLVGQIGRMRDLISLLMEALPHGPLLLLCVYRPEREHRCWHMATIAAQKCRERYVEIACRKPRRVAAGNRLRHMPE